jgi:hypothetical protein
MAGALLSILDKGYIAPARIYKPDQPEQEDEHPRLIDPLPFPITKGDC